MKYLIAHHSADASSKPQFEKIDASHKRRGFPKSELGYSGGYNYLIEKDGTRKQYRREGERGAHTVVDKGPNAKIDFNATGIAVCFAGDFTKENPTQAQIDEWFVLGPEIVDRWGIKLEDIVNHGTVDSTSCPGYPFAELLANHLRATGTFFGAFAWLSASARLNRLEARIERAEGSTKESLVRQRERLLQRISK
jgi:N-acetyl-anhydromuramyl-L-alanine amidase AmpD